MTLWERTTWTTLARLRVNSRTRLLACGLAGLAVLGTVVATGWDKGYPAGSVRLLSGAAWLPANRTGHLVLLDGAAAELVAHRPVSEPGHRLDVVQHKGTVGYAIDRTIGSISRVDTDTGRSRPAVTPIPGAQEGLQLHVGADKVYALDTERGVLTNVDPDTLTNRSVPAKLAREPTATVDGGGRLWVLDAATGDLHWYHGGQRGVRRGAVQPGAGALVTADGSAVLVDRAGQTAATLDPDTGRARHTVRLGLSPGDRLELGASADRLRIHVVSADGRLVVCDLAASRCNAPISLAAQGAEFAMPVESGDTVFVADRATGEVWIVDMSSRRILAKRAVLPPPAELQLFARDGIVYFNDPDSEHAGVIRSTGEVIRVKKYDAYDLGRPLAPDTPAATAPVLPPAPTDQSAGAGGPRDTVSGPANRRSGSREPVVRIMVSDYQPAVGEEVTLQAMAESGPDPVSVHWDFGDGHGSVDLRTTHRWTAPNTYQVSASARFPDGRTTTVTLPIDVGAVATSALLVSGTGAGIVTSQPAGISCPPTCYAVFGRGQLVTLTARPDLGWRSFAWAGDCRGADPTCTLAMDTSRTVFASFEEHADLTVTPLDGGRCYLRAGADGIWDVDLWFTIGWTSPTGAPIPANMLRLTTDTGRTRDWRFSPAPTPPGHVALGYLDTLDTFVDPDIRYLDRVLRVTVTVDPDNVLVEKSETNNRFVLLVDMPATIPPPDENNRQVGCHAE